MMKDLISVIIPVYNVKKYLTFCIDSVLRQSYSNLEIILVDDGSTDGSDEMCDYYASKDARIHVIHQENMGLSTARNIGISASHGDILSLVDSDDFIHPDYFLKAYEAMEATGCDMVCTKDLPFIDGQDQEIKEKWKKNRESELNGRKDSGIGSLSQIFSSSQILGLILHQHISLTAAQLKVYKRTLFCDIEFPAGRLYEDVATTWRFVLKADRIAVLSEPMYAYRVRNGSILHSSYSPQMLDCLWIADVLENGIIKAMPEMKLAAATCIFRVNRIVYAQMKDAPKGDREKVWKVLCKYRGLVFKDKEARLFERIIALSAYGGPWVLWGILQVFKECRKMKIRIRAGR